MQRSSRVVLKRRLSFTAHDRIPYRPLAIVKPQRILIVNDSAIVRLQKLAHPAVPVILVCVDATSVPSYRRQARGFAENAGSG
jgi:hypothetical protein